MSCVTWEEINYLCKQQKKGKKASSKKNLLYSTFCDLEVALSASRKALKMSLQDLHINYA